MTNEVEVPSGVPAPWAEDLDDVYVLTAFARRLRHELDAARQERRCSIVIARSGAGKTTELEEYLRVNPVVRERDGTTRAPVIRVGGITGKHTSKAFVRAITEGFGTTPGGTEEALASWVVRELKRCQTELIVIDDAHGMTSDDLQVIKRLIDELLHLKWRLAVVFLCAGARGAAPFQELLNRPTPQWVQLRRRFSPVAPWVYIASLSLEEIGEALIGYERYVFDRHLPKLRLARWANRIHKHLIHPFFDLDGDQRVTMQHLRDLADRIARATVAAGMADVDKAGAVIDDAVGELHGAKAIREVDSDPGYRIVEAPAHAEEAAV